MVLALIGYAVSIANRYNTGAGIFFMASFVLFVIFTVQWAIADYNLELKVWNRLSDNFESYIASSVESLSGVMGSLGYGHSVSPIVSGVYGGYSVRLFNEDVYTDKKLRQGYRKTYRVLEIQFRQDFYAVFMDSRKLSGISRAVSDNQRLNVEGDVNKFFDIYVPQDSKYNGLITLTPEKLWAIRQYGKKFDVEFTGSSAYIISSSKIRSIKDVLVYQKAVLDLVKDIGVDVERKRSDATESLAVKEPSWWSLS